MGDQGFRMRLTKYMLVMFSMLCALLAQSMVWAQAAPDWSHVRVMTEDLAPLAYIDKKDHLLKGKTAEQVQAAMRKLGIPTPIEIVPWARALKMLNDNPDVFIFNLGRTAERESTYQWVYKTGSKRIGVFALKKRSDIHITSVEDLKKYKIVVLNQNIVHLDLLARGFVQDRSDGLYPMTYEKDIIPFFYAGRADVWVRTYLNEHDLDEQIAALNEDPQQFVRLFDIDEMKVDLYLVTNLKTAADKVLRFRQAMSN
jgi:polar amino acid transport system substrate-binding protein